MNILTLPEAKQLHAGDTLTHTGWWSSPSARPERTFTVVSTDETCIRVKDELGYTSTFYWDGDTAFATVDFFKVCTLRTPDICSNCGSTMTAEGLCPHCDAECRTCGKDRWNCTCEEFDE